MESVLKSLFKRELKAILAPYSDIICALFIIVLLGVLGVKKRFLLLERLMNVLMNKWFSLQFIWIQIKKNG